MHRVNVCLCQCWQVLQLAMCLTWSSGMNRRMWPFLHMLIFTTILQLRVKVCTCLSTGQGVELFCYNTRYTCVVCDIPPSLFLLAFVSQAHSFVLVFTTLSCCTYITLQNYCTALLCCCLLVCHHRHLRHISFFTLLKNHCLCRVLFCSSQSCKHILKFIHTTVSIISVQEISNSLFIYLFYWVSVLLNTWFLTAWLGCRYLLMTKFMMKIML